MHSTVLKFGFLALIMGGVSAHANTQTQQTYADWFTKFKTHALQNGITEHTLKSAMPFTAPIPRVINKDRKQIALISNYWHYQRGNQSDSAIARGKTALKKHAQLFNTVAKKYGIAPETLGALWAMETNYGTYTGKTNVIHALATLAFQGRRAEYFTNSLISALHSIQKNQIPPKTFLGSYDGGYGHFQFMPLTADAYAVDGDGDGKIDILHSLPDAVHSAGNYLHKLGWHANQPWGYHVKLPKSFHVGHSGATHQHPTAYWQSQGITRANGTPLITKTTPKTPDGQTPPLATLILPAGAGGPAFLLYDNWRLLKKWNKSNAYGYAFATIATKLSGQKIILPTPNTAGEKRLSHPQIKFMQQVLKNQGMYRHKIDGWIGSYTNNAVQKYQKKHKLTPDGHVGQVAYQHMANLYGKRPLPQNGKLTKTQIQFIQSVLKTHGLYDYALDGIAGNGTQTAMQAYAQHHKIPTQKILAPTLYTHMQKTYAVPIPK